MKAILTTALIALSVTVGFGQINDYPETGNPTIYQYSPAIKLRRNTNDGGFTQGIQTQFMDGTNNWFFGNMHDSMWMVAKGDYQNPKMVVQASGNVGIGTSEPLTKLHVNGTIRWGVDGSNYIYTGQDAIGTYFEQIGTDADKSKIRFQTSKNGSGSNYSQFIIDPEKGFSFVNLGGGSSNVGIGTSDTHGFKLAVNGKIRAQEIKVEASPWPDYVFAKDYSLPTLYETEKHIKEKGHLPGIPSAEEVKANGINVGEMNAKLLQKIEELTLHLIEKDKEIKRLDKLNDKVAELELKMNKLILQMGN